MSIFCYSGKKGAINLFCGEAKAKSARVLRSVKPR